jgi:hypothetical protein
VIKSSNSLNQVLESILELSTEEQLYLSELLKKRLIDVRRNEIANRVLEAEENYREGHVCVGTVDDLMMMSGDD